MRYISKKTQPEAKSPHELVEQALSPQMATTLEQLRLILKGCSDLVIKQFQFAQPAVHGAILYFDGLVDRKEIEENLLKPLLLELNMQNNAAANLKEPNILGFIQNNILTLAELKTLSTLQEICHHIGSGDTVLLIDGYEQGLAAGTRSWAGRAIQTPENEVTVYGPKEGFCETLRFNTALLRRRIKSSNFKMESMVLGRISKTDIVICYIDNIAPPGMVAEIKERLGKIDIDAVLDTGYLAELIDENKWSIFTQTEHTEKPDRVCGQLLEGKVCIMADGTPMALVLPVSFPEYMISPEDYYVRFIPASLFRILRFMAFVMALLLPSLYIAIITYHHEMIPTPLLLTIAATREGIPFPAFVEALLLDATFELLREAGLRLPRAVGPAVSIVGALIIGDAAVRAGLVSTPMVVVIAFTGIASFVTPSYNAGIIIRIARFGFLFAAGMLGFLGIIIALILMGLRMASLSSFGLPYLWPIAPLNVSYLGDILVRRPWFSNIKRPYMSGMKNVVRQVPKNEDGGQQL
ncbi:MAG: spore germination protein [Syntrophomonadaceae bacterium]|nr:spore germination protein [Syntrophomonadaceae bacterium]